MTLATHSASNEPGSIICAGLSCLDLQLVGCTNSGSEEAIEQYDEAVYCAGGSASMTGTTLALLLREEDSSRQEEVHILTKIGSDFAGQTLLEFYQKVGASTHLVLTSESVRTSMAVLPVYKNGRRGCFVNLACNDSFEADELLSQLLKMTIQPPRAFLFGYPHLLPKMQGKTLSNMLTTVHQKLSINGQSVLIGVDLNGVDGSDPNAAQDALIPALSQIDVLHLNEQEAAVFSSSLSNESLTSSTIDSISPLIMRQISSFHSYGCATVLLSLGPKGALVSITPDANRLKKLSLSGSPSMALSQWKPGTQVIIPAFKIDSDEINTNGAGDALFSGFCLAASSWAANKQSENWSVTPQVAGTFASLVAWQRCRSKTRDGVGMKNADTLINMIRNQEIPEILIE